MELNRINRNWFSREDSFREGIIDQMVSKDNPETDLYFYHTDLPIAIGMGSSSWITDASGSVNQHMQYLPFGEDFISQRNSTWATPYTFTGKERDSETGYSYFGARYYDSDLSVWLSVDPLASKYPSMSGYMYCAGNPVMLVDPDGMHFENPDDEIRANKSKDKATVRIEEYKHRIKELKQNRKNWGEKDRAEYRDNKKMVKILENHKKNLDEMINSEKIEYSYERVIITKETKYLETYVRNGKVIMQYAEGMWDKQAHEETHGHQYLTGEFRMKNGGEDNRFNDLNDEAKA